MSIEAETEGGKEKTCRVGSELIQVAFTEIDDDSEIWKEGHRGALKVNRAGFERIFFDGFLMRLTGYGKTRSVSRFSTEI